MTPGRTPHRKNRGTFDEMRIETPARLPACAGKWHPEERLWLQQFLEAIAADYGDAVKKVVLYGSKARGDWHDESDIDVLVIVRNEEAGARKTLQRRGQELAVTSYAVPGILILTDERWQRLEKSGAGLTKAIAREGINLL